ncbi:hypothetical protein [Salsuginibacillus kocurii]|uniref:hypothetical protein n=1 Tax=Salsuginibacillus kocurii TaxID=427078 RepID=UPI0003615725|nr:hypothetical protein [Salsuginibacillus kocurii]
MPSRLRTNPNVEKNNRKKKAYPPYYEEYPIDGNALMWSILIAILLLLLVFGRVGVIDDVDAP